jgi:hypothetical protein
LNLSIKKVKLKTCKACKVKFEPVKFAQVVCGWACSIKYIEQQKLKTTRLERLKERKVYKDTKDKLKTRQEWLKEAQQLVNKYVRLRDSHLGCVSCDKPANWDGQWHASHFRSVGAAPQLRFNLLNIHKSCSVCNNWKSGNLAEYAPRLRDKIGNDKVDWLLSYNESSNYTVEYAKRLKGIFKRKIKRLEDKLK